MKTTSNPSPDYLAWASRFIDSVSSESSGRIQNIENALIGNNPERQPLEKAKLTILKACNVGNFSSHCVSLRKEIRQKSGPLLVQFQ